MTKPSLIAEAINSNVLREGTTSGDIATFGPLIIPLVEKIYTQSLVSQIASVQPLNSPVGKISAVISHYNGFKSDVDQQIDFAMEGSNLNYNQFIENSRVIVVDGEWNVPADEVLTIAAGPGVLPDGYIFPNDPLVIDGVPPIGKIIYTGLLPGSYAGTVKCLYSESFVYDSLEKATGLGIPTETDLNAEGLYSTDGPYNNVTKKATVLLVTNWNDSIAKYDLISSASITTASSIMLILANRTSIKKYFVKYTGNFQGYDPSKPNYSNFGQNQDSNSNIKFIDIQTRAVLVETKSRKIASALKYEKIQDLKSIYGEKYTDVLSNMVGKEISSEIDIEVINFIKEIAKPMPDIKLTASSGMQSGLFDTSNDLIAQINLAVEDIVRSTKRNRTMFVLADSATIGYLKINPWHVTAETNENNPYRVGKIGPYPLFCDFYSSDNYILIGYIYDSDEAGDAGLIFAPYSHTIHEIKNGGVNFQNTLFTMNRYGYVRNPQDTGVGIGDSDFFRIFRVDFTGETVMTPGTRLTGETYDILNLTKSLIRVI